MIASLVVSAVCSWDNPGANPYRGSVPAAVHSYQDIPLEVRNRLQARMERRQFDEVATIRRDSITGKNDYVDLRDMHFGGNRLCQTVSREKWTDQSVERGLVYCEDTHCLIVPTVCNNVSRVTRIKRLEPLPPVAPKAEGPPLTPYVAVPPPSAPLTFSEKAEPGIPPVPPLVDPTPRGYVPPYLPPYAPRGGDPWWHPSFPPPSREIIYVPIVVEIPEPSTWAMILSGLAAILWVSRRKKTKSP